MRLTTVVELLLILLLVAFAAYGRVIERDEIHHRAVRAATKQSNIGLSTLSLKQATDNVNRYCTCNENICNCCRDFHIPLVQLKGPGCASLQYLQGDNLAVQLSFGDNILTSTVVSGKSPKPVCVPLPGGFTKFCGRIYSIQRDAKNHFKACLGLELQSATELEASLRVSCFRFGPDGLNLRPSEPLPVIETEASEEEDDDDFFGLGSDDDDDDEDDEDEGGVSSLANSVPNSSDAEDENDDEDDDDDEDILGFDSLLEIITGEDETSTKKPKVTTSAPLLQFTIPILTRPTSAAPLEAFEASTVGNNAPIETGSGEEVEEYNQESVNEEESNTASLEESNEEAFSDSTEAEVLQEEVTEATNKIAFYAKPEKMPNNKIKVVEANKKKPSIASISINSIVDETKKKKKPLAKPIKDEEEDEDDDDILDDDLDDDDEDEEILSDEDDEKSDEDDEDKDDEHESHDEDEDEKAEVEDLDDDDDEEEDAMISALVYDDKKKGKKNAPTKSQSSNSEEDDSDYDLGLTGLLARRRSMRSGRQSKVMRL